MQNQTRKKRTMNGLYTLACRQNNTGWLSRHTLITFQSSYDIIILISVVASNN